jgi:pimeloyl-ACP methyl ester carboxylesterase
LSQPAAWKKSSMRILLLVGLLFLTGFPAEAQSTGINLEGYDYPFPVRHHQLSDGHAMAYMLLDPTAPVNGHTMVLLHGKNFNGAYWEETARWLAEQGYRVLIPDQLGFGKSSKPLDYSYTFDQLVHNTESLLEEQQLGKVVVMGHSMGGMLALHWSLRHPQRFERLLLLNPIGLEDWVGKGVPYRGLDGWYARELATTRESIALYQKTFYYDGQWNERFSRWANLLAAPLGSPDYSRLARVQAMTTAMLMSQPVAHRFEQVQVPVWLILGERDRTAPDKDLAPPQVAEQLGRYDRLGPEVVARLPQGQLIPLPGLGHLPHIEDFPRFQQALEQALSDL